MYLKVVWILSKLCHWYVLGLCQSWSWKTRDSDVKMTTCDTSWRKLPSKYQSHENTVKVEILTSRKHWWIWQMALLIKDFSSQFSCTFSDQLQSEISSKFPIINIWKLKNCQAFIPLIKPLIHMPGYIKQFVYSML
jgi:hypothetical protein